MQTKTFVSSAFAAVATLAFATAAHAAETPVLTCETLEIHQSETENMSVAGSITVVKLEDGSHQVTMVSGDKTQTSKNVAVTEAESKDIDMKSITEVLKVIAPQVDVAVVKTATAAMISPINKGDSNMMVVDLKDEAGKSLVKLLNFDDGTMFGHCGK